MERGWILILAIFFSGLTFSQESKRLSSLGLMVDGGRDEYRNYSFSLKIGLDDVWAIGGRYSKSSDEYDVEKEVGKIYLSAYWNKYVSSKLQIKRSVENPNTLKGMGGEFNTRVNFWPFANSLRSSIGITLGSMDYTQNEYYSILQGSLEEERRFSQQYAVFNIEQDISTWLILSFTRSQYSYQDTSSVTLTGRRGNTVSGSTDGGIEDYPDSRSALGLILNFSDFELEMSGEQTNSKIADYDYKTKSLNLVWFANSQLSITVGTAVTDYQSGSESKTYNLGFNFSF